MQRAVYGANANRSFFEVRLNRALLSPNPSLVQIVLPEEPSQADQPILLSDIWRQSYKLTSPNILPTTTTLPTDIALPTAGYVNLDNVDITVFDLADPVNLEANFSTLSVGDSIWVAKVNDHDWNIYRTQNVPGVIQHVCDNLDGTSVAIFSLQHGLSTGDKLIIKFFDSEIDGVYTVLSVPSLDKVTIAYSFTNGRSVANGSGIGFTLQTMRVAQASDVVTLPYVKEIIPGARVWVDDNGSGLWQVIEKQDVFTDSNQLSPVLLDANERFGSSVTQTKNRFAALVGSSNYGFGDGNAAGAVYLYVKQLNDQYGSPFITSDAIFTIGAVGTKGYGNAVKFGNQTWAVAGASKSLGSLGQANSGYATVIYRNPAAGQSGVLPYTQWQLLTTPGSVSADQGEFGYSVDMSIDERWMYIGSPGTNKVYAYGRVDWQNQYVKQISTGTSATISIADSIQVNAITQLIVTLDGAVQSPGTDFTIDGSFDVITFTAGAPAAGVEIEAIRRNTQQLDYAEYFDVTQTSTSGGGTSAEFTIIRTHGDVDVYVTAGGTGYSAGNTITFAPSKFGGFGVTNLVLTVSTVGGSGQVLAFTISYAPVLNNTFSLNELFFTATNINSFTVLVNDALQRPNIDYTFNTGTQDLVFTAGSEPPAGAVIIVRAREYFKYVSELTIPGLVVGDRFGHSIATSTDGRQVMIGCANQTIANAIKSASASGNATTGTATYSNLIQSSTSGSGYGALFNVTRNNQTYSITVVKGGQNYNVGDTITISGTLLGGTSSNNLTITISELTTFVEAGSVYVFDRNVQQFLFQGDSNNVFEVLGTVTGPVSVLVNNEFLTNQVDGVIDANNTFVVAGNNVTINKTLQVGDVIQIETNQFKLVQQITQQTVANFSNTGTAVDLCVNNCSLYIGAPQSSVQIYKGGVVELSINQSRVYGVISATVANPVLTAGQTLRVNNVDIAVPASNPTVQGLAAAINGGPGVTGVPNAMASVANGVLTIMVRNTAAASPTNKLQVLPGSVGTVFADCGFETFAHTQVIDSPYPIDFAGFGSSLSIDDSAVNLVVGSPAGTLYLQTIFDDGTTEFDANSTTFFSVIIQSGAVYTFDYLASSTTELSNPGKFVFGQQISNTNLAPYDLFGACVDYTSGVLMVGAPAQDLEDSSLANYGKVFAYTNLTRVPAWTVVYEQQPVVDIQLLNSVFMYDKITSATTEFFDFINPLQGKILGAARQNIDFVGAVDPASYNVGPVGVTGTTWAESHVGEVWWDLSTVRFIDPNQDSIVYASRRWGQIFPGSSVDVYQWIVSNQSPANYAGPGTVLNPLSYTINTVLTEDGTFQTQYYFWVKGLTSIATNKNKTLSIDSIARYIESPTSSGIPYIAPINASTIALYNAVDIIEAQDTILHVEFDRELTTNNVHVEYELVAQDRPDAWISQTLYRKMQDSFCGVDTAGNLVPDPSLSIAERYGVQFRPRQSMFTDRFEALRNYLTRANTVLAQWPISEIRSFTLLNSSEPIPSASAVDSEGDLVWNKQVANLEILSFQDIEPPSIPVGYKYLVLTDSSNRGLWTIYSVQTNQSTPSLRELELTRVQNYNTPDYWSYINWYLPGYNISTKAVAEVANYSTLTTLSVPVGSSVRVTANAQGKWEIYQLTDTGWTRVGLQDGTIEFSAELWNYALGRFGFDVEVFDAQYFDQEPVIETRKIIQAINEELFVDDLLIERNRALTLVFNFVLSEFSAPEWLVKTSLVDVDHRIRDLVPYQNYRRDNQEFVLDYIQEVKPYHVQVREFNLTYNGLDSYGGNLTDFDLPAYYDTSLSVPQYTSPILLPYLRSSYQTFNINSDVTNTAPIWDQWPYSQWFDNYLLSLDSVTVVDGGANYTEPPLVIIVGEATVPAQAQAILNSTGQVVEIVVIEPGSGYRSTPAVTFDGGNGSGVRAYPVMTNELVRSFRTVIKFDRCQYTTSVLTWSPTGTYEEGTLVRYDNRVWEATPTDSSANVGPTFDLENWTEVSAADLSGVDRTMGYYVPGVNLPGLELPLLVDGVDYPGVQVWGDYFTGTTTLDTEYRSSFADQYLGDAFTDINVEGGEFLGPYEGHSPEELVNGAEYDSFDMRIYTRPGSDWQYDGHGFQIASQRYEYEPAITNEYSWASVVELPVELLLSNVTTGVDLHVGINYTVNWTQRTVTIVDGVLPGEVFQITLYEIGGGYQLFRNGYNGADIDQDVIIPVNSAEIVNIAVFVNGQSRTGQTWEPYADSMPWSDLNTYARLDVVLEDGAYYRALQDVPVGTSIADVLFWFEFVPTLETKVTLATAPADPDFVVLDAFGTVTIPAGYFTPGRTYTITKLGNTNWSSVGYIGTPSIGASFVATGAGDASSTGTASSDYSWSTPQTQIVVANASVVSSQTVQLTNSLQGSNSVNMIVTRNGLRLQPPEGILHVADGSTVSFGLPQRGNYPQSIINATSDVVVFVDDVLQVQTVGPTVGSYFVTNWDGSNVPGRQVVFYDPPIDGSQVVITVNTLAQYAVAGDSLELVPLVNVGDIIEVTTWNDTSQQDILTLVFVGPVSSAVIEVVEPYDSTLFDQGPTVSLPLLAVAPFDFSDGLASFVNSFDLQRTGIEASRLWVTLDGYRLFEGVDFTVEGTYLILASGTISSAQTLVVTEFTNSVVPESAVFRIFQDMRGVQATYRITDATTTTLALPLTADATVAYVTDVSKLNQPNLEAGVFGIVTIGAERIMYRDRDLVTNTLLGLRRGTAGTGAADHAAGTIVMDLGRDNLLFDAYQDYVISDSSLADGSTTIFYAPNISNVDYGDSSTTYVEAIEVYVGGIRQDYWGSPGATSEYRYVVSNFSPTAVEFITDSDPITPLLAPAAGSEVTILIRRGTWWYMINNETERNQSLQENASKAARFLTGRNTG